jgi:tRNA(Ile)-lysidine synthase
MVHPCAPTSERWSRKERPTPAAPDPGLVGRFAADLGGLVAAGDRLGLAVSGGPDSLAMLLLAASARPGQVEAASVDHGLRPEAADEAAMVATVCAHLGVPHSTLTAEWEEKPETRLQERARAERYRLLNQWAQERGLTAVATAHHLDDQAETLMMRLNRGSGTRGLAGMRPLSPLPVPGSAVRLVRPLLGWRRSELEQVCASAGLQPARDPSNCDDQFERVRMRVALAGADWLDVEAAARAAGHLAEADSALDWAADREWTSQVSEGKDEVVYRPSAPAEIRRRIVSRAIAKLATEGAGDVLGGRELDQLMSALADGGASTLRGVRCSGGEAWRFSPAPPRRTA